MGAEEPFRAVTTQYVSGSSGRFAFRRTGVEGGTPLLLLQRFRGTMDDWDPALIDALAREREVIVFDNLGVGASSGSVSSDVAGMTVAASEFVTLIGASHVDLLGWSMGGFVAQALALTRPDIVRRLIVAASTTRRW